MVEINNGDVHNINNVAITPFADIDSLSDSMGLSKNDLMNILTSALLIRGEIRCRLSTKFKCGYEIRPIIWFSKRTEEIESTLKGLGLKWKRIYVKTEDIAKLCHAFKDLFSLSTKEHGLKMVERLNGILPQPLDYEEVKETLNQIQKCSEGLSSQLPSE